MWLIGERVSVLEEQVDPYHRRYRLRVNHRRRSGAVRRQVPRSDAGRGSFRSRIPTIRVVGLGNVIASNASHNIVSIRRGEKLHEELISADDARRTSADDDHYAVAPVLAERAHTDFAVGRTGAVDRFSYRADINDLRLGRDGLSELLRSL